MPKLYTALSAMLFLFSFASSAELRVDFYDLSSYATAEGDVYLYDLESALVSDAPYLVNHYELIDFSSNVSTGRDGIFHLNHSLPQSPYSNTGALITGSVYSAIAQTVTFGIVVDDGAALDINGVSLIREDGHRAFTAFTTTANLQAGWNDLSLLYFNNSGEYNLELYSEDNEGNRILLGDIENGGFLTADLPTPPLTAAALLLTFACGIYRKSASNHA